MRLYVVLDILKWNKLCFCWIFKAALQDSDVLFSIYQTVLFVLILAFIHLVIILTLLMTVDQKWICVNIF